MSKELKWYGIGTGFIALSTIAMLWFGMVMSEPFPPRQLHPKPVAETPCTCSR